MIECFRDSEDERVRLEVLHSYGILDTPPEVRFDRLTRLAASLFDAPICLISLVDQERQWFKSMHGFNVTETPRDVSFCAHAIFADRVMVVPDATLDPRFKNNPLVTGSPYIRTYVGAPLINVDGHRLGTLCLLYDEPHPVDQIDLPRLVDIAATVMDFLELHRLANKDVGDNSRLYKAFTDARANEELFASIADVAEVGGWEVDPETMTPVWTDQTRKIHETPPNFVPTLENALDFYPPHARKLVEDAVQLCVDEGKGFTFELEIDTAKGRRRWVRSVGKAVHKDGKVVKVVGAFQDITDALEEKRRLSRANEEKDRALASLSAYQSALDRHAIVSVTDKEGRVTSANQNYCRLTGYTMRELIGLGFETLSPEFGDPTHFGDLHTAVASGLSWRGEAKVRRKDGGHFWVDTTIVPIRQADGSLEKYVSFSYDITAQKTHQSELEEKRLEAEAANIAKGQFLATMSHEIRTPMNGITGMLDLALSSELSGVQRERLTVARNSAGMLLSVLNDILDLSKLEAGKVEIETLAFCPAEMLSDLTSLFEFKAEEKGIVLRAEGLDTLPQAVASDPTRIRQVLTNLVSNAIKFTSQGGVTIAAFYEDATGELVVDVRDTGIGIPESKLSSLFERFTQTDASMTRRFGGTGLGLAISKQLVDLLGGSISVASSNGSGSTFTVRVPCKTATLTQAKPLASMLKTHTSSDAATPMSGLRILVAEDNKVNQMVVAAFLDSLGHDHTIVDNGAEACAALDKDSFDVILMDIQMPEMDGLTATHRIRARSDEKANLPIIALTANAMAGDKEQYLANGMTGYVAKPIEAKELAAAITRASSASVATLAQPSHRSQG